MSIADDTHSMTRPNPQRIAQTFLGLHRELISSFYRNAPSRRKRGPKRPGKHVLSGQQMWALAMARVVRSKGESLESAYGAYDRLMSWTPQQIEQWFSEGRVAMNVVNGAAFPELSHPLALLSGANARLVQQAKDSGTEIRLYVFDVEPMWNQIALYLATVHEQN